MLLDKIRSDLQNEMKSENVEKRNDLKVIVAEFQRGKTKEPTDADVLNTLKSLEKNELERLSAVNETSSNFLALLQSYLPKSVTKEELIEWVSKNINVLNYSNKNQIIGVVKKVFGVSADGKLIKEVVDSL